MQKKEDPDILFLFETRMNKNKVEKLRYILNMPNLVFKAYEGKSEGLALLWKRDVNLALRWMGRMHIDATITEADGFKWRLTGIYGQAKTELKEETWKLLRTLHLQEKMPWVCMGDFNEILYNFEKQGGVPRTQAYMDHFHSALNFCNLNDLGFEGDIFTWRNNNYRIDGYIRERLDRVVANAEWCMRFPGYKVVNGCPEHSDHRPVILHVDGAHKKPRPQPNNLNKRFEARWLLEEDCEKIVKEAWQMAKENGDSMVAQLIKAVSKDLDTWSREVLGDLQQRIKNLKAELEKYRQADLTEANIRKEQVARAGAGANHNRVLQDVEPRVTDQMNEMLGKEYTPEEIKKALDDMGDLKALGADVIANQLKMILDEIISDNQGAFVPGRLISDNTILAYELTHFMKRKRKGKDVYMALKLDMRKAYDRVEFLEGMMRKMVFREEFVQLIMKQGDSISPYLFLLCAEGLSAMLNKADAENQIKGIKLAPTAPRLNHLLFADDSLLVLEATTQGVQPINSILHEYEECSGQVINREKSSVMFSSNDKQSCKNLLLQELQLGSESTEGKYLGLPTYIGKSKKKCFDYIKERIIGRLQGGWDRCLSTAGKEIYVKAVAQAIPTYAMACFDLTKTLCDEISQLIC
ncbi:uncharacterized protein [Aegilops tauschii subsp. strangulata]|uniref:uncharacterized protein n=1 Tax=Aegilops tauschii subsp. strangulata TaxID=200361 RepID=UPI00098B4D54|nr:uncharacterized protein LOC109763511 [Aegilops tauschii subsp. strangulata]